MMTSITSVALASTVPAALLVVLAVITAGLLGYGIWRRARGTLLRAIPLLALLIALADPVLLRENRAPLADVVALVVDDTASQKLGQRSDRTAKAVEKLTKDMKAQQNLDVRTVHVTGNAQDGSRLFTAMNEVLDDVPAQRLAGAIMVTDGQVHDTPSENVAAHAPWRGAPVHVLLSGERGEHDRRVRIERAPDFGLVDQMATVRLRVEDTAAVPGTDIAVTLRRDGSEPQTLTVPAGQSFDLPVKVANVGLNVFELDVAAADDELSKINNRTLVTITGVRDRLRVLLISGQPHVGERAWRNLLKSDPNVDLVHFTILRPLTKDDGTPLNELALIQFPIRELFDEQLKDFDLVIFDRYSRKGLVPFQFMSNVAAYVRGGGAVMLAVGPEYADAFSLYDSPLQTVLPAAPTGQVATEPFRPRVSPVGNRHPVTAELTGTTANDAAPQWGRWLRRVDVSQPSGETVMTGADGTPLLVLNRVEKGRVALLLSDTIWLWGKNFDGGGPQAELLRRVSHWLMKEPELEEEALSAEAHNDALVIKRQSIQAAEKPVTVTGPDGTEQTVTPRDMGRGRFAATLPAAAPGLYRLTDGEHTAVAAVGSPNPLENFDIVTTDAKVGPIAESTGGGVYWMGNEGIPNVRRVAEGRATHGASWFGLRANDQYTVTGIAETSLAPGLLVMLFLMGGAMLAWWREGQ